MTRFYDRWRPPLTMFQRHWITFWVTVTPILLIVDLMTNGNW